jgi:hypothetical protein
MEGLATTRATGRRLWVRHTATNRMVNFSHGEFDSTLESNFCQADPSPIV